MASGRRSHRGLSGLFLLVVALLPEAAHAQVAVVVNRANPVTALTLEQLRRLFLGSSTTFPGGHGVTLVESPAVRAGFYRALLGLTEEQVKRHWLSIVFGGEGGNPPKEIAETQDLRRFVGENPGAIAFLLLSEVDNSVKIVAINGAKPGDASYPLRGVPSDSRRERAQ
jgi:hypothetical protein